MVLLLCAAPPAAPAYPALLHGHLIAPDLEPSLITPRAHWRQLPIKGRGLFHAYNVQIRNNDGEPFRWTPNVQLISKVDLRKHTSQPRTYNLNKQDANMVKAAVTKKL